MFMLQIGPRATTVDGVSTEYVPGPKRYPEYVFNGAFGGGKVLAQGLDEEGKIRGIVYAPSSLADKQVAEVLAEEVLMAGVKGICRVRFSPFNLGEAT